MGTVETRRAHDNGLETLNRPKEVPVDEVLVCPFVILEDIPRIVSLEFSNVDDVGV
jgi:hypothetical protein